jgi:hypothetical protein
MERQGPLLYLQEPATGLYPEPPESTQEYESGNRSGQCSVDLLGCIFMWTCNVGTSVSEEHSNSMFSAEAKITSSPPT